jgi:hypothetical protein
MAGHDLRDLPTIEATISQIDGVIRRGRRGVEKNGEGGGYCESP